MAESVVTLRVDASGATRALQGVQKQSNTLQRSFGGLKTALLGVGFTAIAKQTVVAATTFENLNQRLKILTQEYGTYSESLKLAEEAQSKFGLSSIDALEGVTNLQARLGPLGSTMDEITAIFNGFNTAAILSGASAQEQAGAMRQLTQALGSGVLRGDEFNSISEQMSAVLAPIAKQLGVNVGALRDMAAEGKITKDVVVAAFKEIENQGSGALKELIRNDPTMTFKILGNETQKLSIAVGKVLAPAVLDGVQALTKIVEAATKFVNSPIGKTAAIFTAIALAAKGVAIIIPTITAGLTALAAAGGLATVALNALPLVAIATAVGAVTTALIAHNSKQKEFNKLVKEGGQEVLRAEMAKIDAERLVILGRLSKAEENNNKRAVNSLTKQLNILHGQYKLVRDRLHDGIRTNNEIDKSNKKLEDNKKVQEEINQLVKDNLQKQIENEQAEMDRVEAIGKFIDEKSKERELLRAIQNGNEDQVRIQHAINDAVAIYGEEYRDIIEAYITGNAELDKQNDKLDKSGQSADKLKEKMMAVGEEIEGSIKNNLRDAITGAQSFGDAMTNVLNRIRDKIIDAQIDKIFGNFGENFGKSASGGGGKGLGGFFGNILGGLFANGGRPPVGKASIVGERGPEVFVPTSSGTIIPNNMIGGGGGVTNMVTVNVDASGAPQVQGSTAEANQLGQLIGVAIQEQLVKEKRPGGLLA